MTATNRLLELQDEKYAEFQAKLIPNIPTESIIGVRIPRARKLAKELGNTPEKTEFLNNLPHEYYDENILHALLISNEKDINECILLLEKFLPYVDNWAVCDILSPKIFKKNKQLLPDKIREWARSDGVYIRRFAVDMLMMHFLDDDFREEYLEIPIKIKLDDYYIKMAVAWYFATALAKQWNPTIKYLENNSLERWTHNKTIQKALESYRITDAQKTYLRSLKRRM